MSSPSGPENRPGSALGGSSLNANSGYRSDGDNKLNRFAQGPGHHQQHGHLPMPGLSGNPNSAVGNLLKGAVGENGDLKDAALQVGIKLDLEAEVHLTARVRGDIIVGLY